MSSAAAAAGEVVEHVVLFKVKPETSPAKVNDMLRNLTSLSSLPQIAHIAAGAILRCKSRSTDLNFTHMLHSRYRSKSDLAAYSAHPDHTNVVKGFVLPISDDIMAVDWVGSFSGPIRVPPGSGIRVRFLKLGENVGEGEKNELLRGIKEKLELAPVEQVSVGENFSPARAKGFSVASIAVFRGLSELENVDLESEDEVKEIFDGEITVDFVVPAEQSASL